MKNSIAQFKIVPDSSYSVMLSLSDRGKQILIFGTKDNVYFFQILSCFIMKPINEETQRSYTFYRLKNF